MRETSPVLVAMLAAAPINLASTANPGRLGMATNRNSTSSIFTRRNAGWLLGWPLHLFATDALRPQP